MNSDSGPVSLRALDVAATRAIEFLRGLEQRPTNATVDAATLRERLDRPLARNGMPADEVIERLVASVEGGLVGMPAGRFFAWVIGGSLPSALGADWLTSAWGQNAAFYAASPASSVIEEVVGKWLKDIFGLPSTASFALVTGCQMAHVTCLAAARHSLLRERGWNVEERGLSGAPQIRILSSERQHASIERAVRLLGLGTQWVTLLAPNDREVLDITQIESALATFKGEPTILLLQAGDLNTGVFDSFESIIPIAKRHRAWVHVDGAFGLWAAASSQHRSLTQGVDAADSWATDGHKWLNVPFDCGYAFVRVPNAHRSAMSVSAPYIAANTDVRDQIDWTPEFSRRARAFSTYAALMELGRSGLSSLIERSCGHAAAIVEAIGRLPGADVLWRPIINQGLVRFLDRSDGAASADHDRRTEAVIQTIVASGDAFFGATTWREQRAMRVSVVNWRTCERDVTRAVAAVARALGEVEVLS